MKKKVADLTGPELDYFVAKARGWEYGYTRTPTYKMSNNEHIAVDDYSPSTNGAQAMELVKEFRLFVGFKSFAKEWVAGSWINPDNDSAGPTPEIAICRAVVASAFGDEVSLSDDNVASKFGEYVEVSGDDVY